MQVNPLCIYICTYNYFKEKIKQYPYGSNENSIGAVGKSILSFIHFFLLHLWRIEYPRLHYYVQYLRNIPKIFLRRSHCRLILSLLASPNLYNTSHTEKFSKKRPKCKKYPPGVGSSNKSVRLLNFAISMFFLLLNWCNKGTVIMVFSS